MSDLPSDYDCIIIGTGLTESILSAALSRIGKTVLHIDQNDFYGDEFSSHSIESLLEIINSVNQIKDLPEESLENDKNKENLQEKTIEIDLNKSLKHFYSEKYDYEWSDVETKEKLLKQSRKFNIDLAPNLYFSNGKLIDILIKSDVSKYCEFKLITRILTFIKESNGNAYLEQIPTCRADIFKSKNLSIIEKRLMMQFLQKCLSSDETRANETLNCSTFYDYLVDKKLSDKVINYLINSIAMCKQTTLAQEGISRCRKFLTSVGIYGDTPFLYSLYGNGELSQAFCRLSAVFGGLFHLNLNFKSLNIDLQTNEVTSINCELNNKQEQLRFNCKYLIVNIKYMPKKYFNQIDNNNRIDVSKCILITNKSIFKEEKECLSFLYLPETEKSPEIYVIETSSTANTCSNGYYLVYMTCTKRNSTAKQDFEEAIDFLFNKNTQIDYELPIILFSCYFSHLNTQKSDIRKADEDFKNVFFTKGCGSELDYEFNISQAKEIFNQMYPNEEFLPKPPDPEHIIFDDDTENQQEKKKNQD